MALPAPTYVSLFAEANKIVVWWIPTSASNLFHRGRKTIANDLRCPRTPQTLLSHADERIEVISYLSIVGTMSLLLPHITYFFRRSAGDLRRRTRRPPCLLGLGIGLWHGELDLVANLMYHHCITVSIFSFTITTSGTHHVPQSPR